MTEATNKDELFELCKEVYRRIGLGEDLPMYEDGKGIPYHDVPLYTSDYLLDKLPLGENINMFFYRSKGGLWLFQWTGRNLSGSSDTPLKALLKLTIALHDAGEI